MPALPRSRRHQLPFESVVEYLAGVLFSGSQEFCCGAPRDARPFPPLLCLRRLELPPRVAARLNAHWAEPLAPEYVNMG